MARFRLNYLDGSYYEGDFDGPSPATDEIIDAFTLGGRGYARYIGRISGYYDGESVYVSHFVEIRKT